MSWLWLLLACGDNDGDSGAEETTTTAPAPAMSVVDFDCMDMADAEVDAFDAVRSVEMCVDECDYVFAGGQCCWPVEYVIVDDGRFGIIHGCAGYSDAIIRVRW